MRFGSTLRLLRVNAGLSLRALSRQVGVSSAYLSRVENGRDPVPTPDRLAAIAGALGLPAETLVELAHQTAPALADYLQRVPSAAGFFLEVARRDLSAPQIARLRRALDEQVPDHAAEDAPSLSERIGSRVRLGASCSTMSEAIDEAARLCIGSDDRRVAGFARAMRARESISPTLIGKAVAVPHAVLTDEPPVAALITLAHPMPYRNGREGSVEVVFAVLSNASGQPHLELLAQVARLANHGVASALRNAQTHLQAIQVIQRYETV